MAMRFVKGRVKAGKIVDDGERLVDGTEVGVILHEDEPEPELTPELLRAIDEGIADADAGRLTPGPEFLRKLARHTSSLSRRRRRAR
jgi:hypothetical protein